MENFIFILFAILLFGFKQYQKSLKKKNNKLASSPQKTNTNSRGLDIENLDESLNDFVNKFFGNQHQNTVADTVSSNDYQEYETNYNEIVDDVEVVENKIDKPYSVEDDDSIDLKKRYNKQFEINKNKEILLTETTDFDLRKAVIYDAVLNPPYIIN